MSKLPTFEHIQEPEARQIIDLLVKMIESQKSINEELVTKVNNLTKLLQGSKPERMPSIDSELKKDELESEEEKQKKRDKANQKRKTNKAKKKELRTEEVQHTIPQGELKCEHCGDTEFKKLGKGKQSSEYEYIPAQLIQRRHIREQKICRCEKTIKTAPMAERVGEACHHGPELHAHVVVSKCLDGIPLHRMVGQFARKQLGLAKSTLCDMFHRTANQLEPLHKRLLELIRQSKRTNADETRIQVWEKKQTRTAWMWTFISATMLGFVYSLSMTGSRDPIRGRPN